MKRGLPDFFTIKSMKRSENKRTNCSNWNPKYISPCIHVIYTMHTLSIMIGYFPSAILGKTPSPTPNQAGIPRIGSTTNWLLPNKLNSKKHSAQMWFISGMKYYYSYAVFRGFFCKYTIWFFFYMGKKLHHWLLSINLQLWRGFPPAWLMVIRPLWQRWSQGTKLWNRNSEFLAGP